LRQVSHHDNFIGELVDEAKTKQTEHKAKGLEEHVEQQPKKQETLQSQHPLTQEGNRRCTKEDCIKWQVANSLNEMKSQKDWTLAKHKRLGKSLQKGAQPISQPFPSPEIPVTNNTPNNPNLKPSHKDNIWNINSEEQNIDTSTEQKILPGNLDKAVSTQQSDLFKAEHVDAVLSELTIGDDLTEEQCVSIDNLLCEFADCFALSMSEVTVVAGAIHKINIPEGTTFKKKVNQCPLSRPQRNTSMVCSTRCWRQV
jgi:hypothetical protein